MLNDLLLHQKNLEHQQIMVTVDGAIRVLTIAMLSRHISFSFFALLIWDMLLTLKDEVRWPCL